RWHRPDRGRGALGAGGAGLALAASTAWGWFGLVRPLHPFEPVVEQELVTGGWQQPGGGLLHPDSDHPAVQLAQLVHQRGEVAVPGAHHEGGDVVALEGHLDGVHHHLDVSGVLPGGAHTLRHLDRLDLVPGERPAVFVEVGPVRVGPARHHPAPHGERIGDRSEVERHPTEVLPRPQREVLVVEEHGHALFGVHTCHSRGAGLPCPPHRRRRSAPGPVRPGGLGGHQGSSRRGAAASPRAARASACKPAREPVVCTRASSTLPRRSCPMVLTATSSTPGWAASQLRTSSIETLCPPTTTTSSARPCRNSRPAWSRWPRSPASWVLALAWARHGELTRTCPRLPDGTDRPYRSTISPRTPAAGRPTVPGAARRSAAVAIVAGPPSVVP